MIFEIIKSKINMICDEQLCQSCILNIEIIDYVENIYSISIAKIMVFMTQPIVCFFLFIFFYKKQIRQTLR